MLSVLLVPVVMLSGCIDYFVDEPTTTTSTYPHIAALTAQCTEDGGIVERMPCCADAGDFPSMCLVGACACAPEDSVEVYVCMCPYGRCWNGYDCVIEGV